MTEDLQKVFVYVVRRRGDDWYLLAFESHDEPGWEVPKGATEGRESSVDTAYRELHEESGLMRASLSNAEKIGSHVWCGEVQTFFLTQLQDDAPWDYRHRVTGQGGDAGLVYRFRWLPVTNSLGELLVQGSGAYARQLLTRFCNSFNTKCTAHTAFEEDRQTSSPVSASDGELEKGKAL